MVTHLDIALVVSVVSQFISTPTIKHWEALEQILCYFKRAPRLCVLYINQGHTRVECLTNAEYA